MDIRVLRYFLTVAREESFSRAAEAYHPFPACVNVCAGKNLRCCLYNKSSKKATDVLLRQIPLFCTLLAEVMKNDIFRKAANTQKE